MTNGRYCVSLSAESHETWWTSGGLSELKTKQNTHKELKMQQVKISEKENMNYTYIE